MWAWAGKGTAEDTIKIAKGIIHEAPSHEVAEAQPTVNCLAAPVTEEYDDGILMTEAELWCGKYVDVEPKTALGLKLNIRRKYAANSKRLCADAPEKQPIGLQKRTYNRSRGAPVLTGIQGYPLAGSGEHPLTEMLKIPGCILYPAAKTRIWRSSPPSDIPLNQWGRVAIASR